MASTPKGYSNNHHRTYRERGKAREYLCAQNCGRQATQWAQTHGTDGTSSGDYRPLCRSCHAKYDGAIPPSQVGKKPANAAFSDDQAEEIRALVASGVPQAEVARQYGCVKQIVWRIVHKVSYTR